MGEKGIEYHAVRDTFLSLNELQLEMEKRRVAEKESYVRRWLPDADTTDADSRNRRRAEEIVNRAIEAMGGLERMVQVQDKRVVVETYDPMARTWSPDGERFYYRGFKFMEKLAGGLWRGYDSRRAWAYQYGVARSVSTGVLKQQAERWDFLSQFKGDGVVLHYLGRKVLPGGQWAHTVQVDDRKYGLLQDVYFDPQSHLMVAYSDGRGLVKIQEYRTVKGIQVPYEVWSYFSQFVVRNRFTTTFNSGLKATLFDNPGGRKWDALAMVALFGGNGQVKPQISLNEIVQMPTVGGKDLEVDHASRTLLNAYLNEKLDTVGALGNKNSRYQAQIIIRGYYREAILLDPAYTIKLHLLVTDKQSESPLLDRVLSHRWRPAAYPPINAEIADRLTMILVESMGQALVGKPN